jgi:hypothetical protein
MLPPLARPVWGLNHVIAYGQSLATGWEGWPALSRTARYDTLMLGDSVRPRDEFAADFVPTGSAALRPLTATVQRQDGTLLSEAEVARLPRDDVAMGETVLEAAVNYWRGRMLAAGAAAGTRQLVASACGVGGRTLETLSKGAAPELFNRLRGCVRLGREVAAAAGRSYGVTALLFLQGEHNNWQVDGAVGDAAGYYALFRRFHADVLADVAAGTAGQVLPPAVFTYQTGGAYATDRNEVPMAQLRAALEIPGVFMAAPVYPVTDKGGHLDANGYRWLGAQFGKVLHLVLTEGRDWKPLYPLSARCEGRVVILRFHVPVPPVRFGVPYAGTEPLIQQDKGFLVRDAAGEIAVRAEIDGADGVALHLERAPGPGLTVTYAGRHRHHGRGSLHDSDATVADDCYEYAPGRGHREKAEIAELMDKPYPLMNWCVAFRMDVDF